MHAQAHSRTRLGILILPLCGLIYGVSILVRGPYVDPSRDATRFAELATGAGFVPGWLGILLGFVLNLGGMLALSAALVGGPGERPASWGAVLGLPGVALAIPLTGFMAFAAPTVSEQYLRGQRDVLAVAVAGFSSAQALAVLSASGVLYIAGTICFAVAIWRSDFVPSWVAPPYALQAPLLAVAGSFSFAAELLGAVLLVLSGAVIARGTWRHIAGDRATATAERLASAPA